MEFFPDRGHVRLRSRAHGSFMDADEDGVGVSQSLNRASMNTAWAVHRVVRDGSPYLLLQSCAYGRYLSLRSKPEQHRGFRLDQGVYVSPEQDDVLWVAIRAPGRSKDVFVRHSVHKDFYLNEGDIPCKHWMIEAIPPRPAAPLLPRPVPGDQTHRKILYLMIDNEGNPIPNSSGSFHFKGRSCFQLRATMATKMNKVLQTNITLCLYPGSQERLIPPVSDLPDSNETIAIAILTTGSPAAQVLVYPNLDAL